jgi:hypothetical protein
MFKSAGAMLKSGQVPPNTPAKYREDLSKVNFLTSKKFFVVFSSVILLGAFYGVSVFLLFLTAPMPTIITTSFVTLFTKVIEIFAIIIASYLGVQTALDFKVNSSSNVSQESEIIVEDITQHIIEEGSENAPRLRPYSQFAIEE